MSMSKTIQFVAFTFACMVILACEPDFPNSAKSSSGFAFDYYSPQWSPNDGSILFGYGKSLYKVESNGGSLDTIYKWRKGKFETAQSPHISPDGTRIAYSTVKSQDVVWEIINLFVLSSRSRLRELHLRQCFVVSR